jgi:hypothetical protein
LAVARTLLSGEKTISGVDLAEQAPAHAQDHHPVAAHQHFEGGLLPRGNETIQQLFVG